MARHLRRHGGGGGSLFDLHGQDEFNYSDIEAENDDDDDDDDAIAMDGDHDDFSSVQQSNCSILVNMLDSYEWSATLSRITTHPEECRVRCSESRNPLHVACNNDAPVVVIQALLEAYPEASIATGSSNMNPLHIACSSRNASVHVVRVLLQSGLPQQVSMRDVDGDTPLHAACRCGASVNVLNVLLLAYPEAVHINDYEGLNPLQRLWVRYFVILGEDVINSVNSQADLVGELLEAWNKTELLLQGALFGSTLPLSETTQFSSCLHAAAAVDCPRPVVRIAAALYSHRLNNRDNHGRTPLMMASAAPIYKHRDLGDSGFSDIMNGEDAPDLHLDYPSVIEILLTANVATASQGACLTDPSGRLALHMALETGKDWYTHGVAQLVAVFPDSLSIADRSSKLFPCFLAAVNCNLTTVYELLRLSPNVLERRRLRRKATLGTDAKMDE
jgi:Ankyrin repeats (3 copies)